MDFYSFRFGDMKMVQADAASQKLMAVEMGPGFRRPDRHTVEALNLTVHIPHAANQTVTATLGTLQWSRRRSSSLPRAWPPGSGPRRRSKQNGRRLLRRKLLSS